MNRQEKGSAGETVAARYLMQQGLRILERNFHTRYGEIDLIAQEGKTVVFIEVKTRGGAAYGRPAEAVTASKQKKLRIAAALYLQQYMTEEIPVRFDVIEVFWTERPMIHHIKNAF